MAIPTKKQLAVWHKRRLNTFRKQALKMAAEWEDLDQFCAISLVDLVASIDVCTMYLIQDDTGGQS